MSFKLLRTQQNEVLESIKWAGLNPNEFEWEEISSQNMNKIISKIKHKYDDYYFIFDYLNERDYAIYSPGKNIRIQRNYPGNWYEQTLYVKKWLIELKKVIEAPNLWDEIEKYKPTFSLQSIERLDNKKINKEEVVNISNALKSLENKIESEFQELKAEDINFIKSELQYLSEAGKRLGRKDWILLSIGQIVGIVWTLGLNPVQATLLWESVQELFKNFLNF